MSAVLLNARRALAAQLAEAERSVLQLRAALVALNMTERVESTRDADDRVHVTWRARRQHTPGAPQVRRQRIVSFMQRNGGKATTKELLAELPDEHRASITNAIAFLRNTGSVIGVAQPGEPYTTYMLVPPEAPPSTPRWGGIGFVLGGTP